MSNLFSHFLNKYLPSQCFLCAGILQTQERQQALCTACQQSLPYWQASQSCPQCGLPGTDGYHCGACLQSPPAFDSTVALYLFQEPIKALIHAGKFGQQWPIFQLLAEQLAQTLAPPRVDYLIPLPLHRARLAERGFNQALEVAQILSSQWHIPLQRNLLQRIRDTEHQARLSARARWKNLRGAFSCNTDCTGKRILVLDDVMTSGASLQVAAKTLKAAGAEQVINLVIARTPARG